VNVKTTLKRALAKQVARFRPTLFYYSAPSETRVGFNVRRNGGLIEVIRPAARQMIRINAGNAIYLPDMLESFDYYFNSADPVSTRYRGEMYSLIDFSSPRLHHVAGFDDFAVLCPSSTEPFSTTAQYLGFAGLKPGDNVIDLGTYSGLTAIAFSREVGPEGKVVALEPDPINFSAAQYNVATHARVNKLKNIVLAPMAAAGTDGVLEMSSEGTMGSALVSIVGGYRGTTVKVEARTLNSIAREFGLAHVAFVKIDIEGAEKFLVPASGEFFKKYRPRLLIEGHMVEGVSTIDPLVDYLHGIGYDCRIEGQEGLTFLLILAWPKDLAGKSDQSLTADQANAD
jgi:FkbM family methyltransferase